MGVKMLGDLHIKQVFHFNRVRYNKVPLFSEKRTLPIKDLV